MSVVLEYFQYLKQLEDGLIGSVLVNPEDYEDNVDEKEKVNLSYFFMQGYTAEYLIANKDTAIFFSYHALFDALEAILRGKSTGLEVFKESAKFLKILGDVPDDILPKMDDITMDFYNQALSDYPTYVKRLPEPE